MANETTTGSQDDLFDATRVGTRILQELRPFMVSRQFFRYQGKIQGGAAFKFTLQDDPGAATAKAEGVTMQNTQLTTSAQTATPGTVGMQVSVTDELQAISLIDARSHDRDVVVRSVGEKYENDFTALMDDFSNTVGVSGSDATAQNILDMRSGLLQREIPGQYVIVGHPVQTEDVASDIITSAAAYWGNTNAMIGGVDVTKMEGYAGAPFGIPMFRTTAVVTANGGADRAGAMFAVDHALGLYEIWATRVEFDREIATADIIAVTARYGVVEVRDTAGVSWITDA